MEDDDDDEEQVWDMGLGLSIGLGDQYYYYVPKKEEHKNKRVAACLDLSFPLYPKDQEELARDHISGLYKTTEGIFSSNTTIFEEDDQNDTNKHQSCSRKKLRLTKEQTSMLEDSFKMHSTLNTVQKQALALRLNLKPRQVEVWFQNRRARSKLKQTEVDCGFLKKCCENLSEENQRLKKEIQELVVSLKLEKPAPLYIQLPKAATLTMCPSCHKFF